ncbi:calcium-transporting ATPase 12, plasma membrane-type-like [Lycium ferocissimum]|uniref:calcium-transporting ATPase 12, plasma membrane-type-like n=1 Tax=Lycium ferocissimum TaxID=112874 RepID=UPI0028162B9A|nr:calcium-transporting ATPase 12, plasma membrane-type-like [Lycium ferocissimum]
MVGLDRDVAMHHNILPFWDQLDQMTTMRYLYGRCTLLFWMGYRPFAGLDSAPVGPPEQPTQPFSHGPTEPEVSSHETVKSQYLVHETTSYSAPGPSQERIQAPFDTQPEILSVPGGLDPKKEHVMQKGAKARDDHGLKRPLIKMKKGVETMARAVEMLTPYLSSLARKRWRLAFHILSTARALLFTARKVVAENKSELLSNFSRSQSYYTAVDIEPECFSSISKPILAKLVRLRDAEQLRKLDGVEGLLSVLKADAEKGILGDVASRRKHFGTNTYKKPQINLSQILLKNLKDPNMIIVLLYAVISLGFGIKKHGLKGCLDGSIILVAVFLAIILSACCWWWHKQQIYELCRPIESVLIPVIRNGKDMRILLSEVLVGDVIRLKAGDQVPADGIYIDQQSLQIDESTITRKNDIVEVNNSCNLFLLSGSKVLRGNGRMLVTAVGMNTALAEIISPTCFNHDHKSLLQKKLHKLTSHIAKVGLGASSLVLLVLLVRYFTGNMRNNGRKFFVGGKTSIQDVWKDFIGILATPVALASAAIPEGLALACALAIAYSTKKMVADQAVVRSLSACEAIASATVICTSKEGILTENSLQVTQFWLGEEYIGRDSFSSFAPEILDLLHEGMALNTTKIPPGSSFEHIEDLVQNAILAWGIKSMKMDVEQLKNSCTIVPAESFNSEYQGRILIRRNADSRVHMHHKGTPEAILAMCSRYYKKTGDIQDINDDARAALQRTITKMKMDGLHCVGFAYRSVTAEHQIDHEGHFHPNLKEDDSILLAFIGLKAPCRKQARKAVMDCQDAGVNIKIFTKDDIHTARASAIDCGIIDHNHEISTGEVLEGTQFQEYAEDERLERVEKICVIARASTLDKLLMVRCLQKKGHVVAVTEDREGDAEVLREANVRLSLGNQGTDTERDNSDTVTTDDNFASIARVLNWGRTTYDKVQIFTQYQLTATIASLVIDFVTAISASKPQNINIVTVISAGNVPYATLQVLWVKLIVGTLAALALTIDRPGTKLMQQPPTNQNEPFITNTMWKNIVGQALYLISVLLTIQYQLSDKEKDTMIFNIFVLCQLFNIFNLRKYEGNLLSELRTKSFFWVIVGMIVIIQVAMVEMFEKFASTEKLNWEQWKMCIGIAALSWPEGETDTMQLVSLQDQYTPVSFFTRLVHTLWQLVKIIRNLHNVKGNLDNNLNSVPQNIELRK